MSGTGRFRRTKAEERRCDARRRARDRRLREDRRREWRRRLAVRLDAMMPATWVLYCVLAISAGASVLLFVLWAHER
jgi:hypothetical protein